MKGWYIPIILLVMIIPVSVIAQTQQPLQLTVIEREICADVIVDVPDNSTKIPVCVKLQILLLPGDRVQNDLVIDIPVTLSYNNVSVTRTVKIPLKIEGRVVGLYIKNVEVGSSDDVIWATVPAPAATPTVTAPAWTPPPTTYVPPQVVTIRVTETVTMPATGQGSISPETILVVLVLVAVIVVAIIMTRRKPPTQPSVVVREEKKEEEPPALTEEEIKRLISGEGKEKEEEEKTQ